MAIDYVAIAKDALARIPSSTTPVLKLFAGGPGAGKSTLRREMVQADILEHGSYLLVDLNFCKRYIAELVIAEQSHIHPEKTEAFLDIYRKLVQVVVTTAYLQRKSIVLDDYGDDLRLIRNVLACFKNALEPYYTLAVIVLISPEEYFKRQVALAEKEAKDNILNPYGDRRNYFEYSLKIHQQLFPYFKQLPNLFNESIVCTSTVDGALNQPLTTFHDGVLQDGNPLILEEMKQKWQGINLAAENIEQLRSLR